MSHIYVRKYQRWQCAECLVLMSESKPYRCFTHSRLRSQQGGGNRVGAGAHIHSQSIAAEKMVLSSDSQP